MMKNLFKGGKERRLKNRLKMLVAMGVCGLVLVGALYLVSEFLLVCFAVGNRIDVVEKFLASLYVIFLGLPTAIMLWFFRTHDTSEQIQKTKESIEVSVLFGAQEMLFAPNVKNRATAKNAIGFVLLMDLRQRELHRSAIDLATSSANLSGIDLAFRDLHEVDLSAAKLQSVNLSEADLAEANLRNADLTNANLQNANLQGADLAEADLRGTDLRNSDLRGADLRQATYMRDVVESDQRKAVFTGALYSDKTKFSGGFDPEKHGMKKVG